MSKYRVQLSALASVRGAVEVEAPDEEQAQQAAINVAEEGNVEWRYDGVHADETIQALSACLV